jgi:hypothetical protein
MQQRTDSWRRVRADNVGWLPASVVGLYDGLLARLADYWDRELRGRLDNGSNVTVNHGDAYFANFLCPRQPGGATYLLDWQSPGFDHPGLDMVNLCATFWNRQQRAGGDREAEVLRRYHRGLVAGGVNGYTFENLLDDYRHGLIFWALVPVQDAADGSARDYWWPKMQCLLDAFVDHGCAATHALS